LELFDWGNLREELEAQPEIIDILSHTEVMMGDLISIHNLYLDHEFHIIRTRAQFLADLLRRLEPTENVVDIGAYELTFTPGSQRNRQLIRRTGPEVRWHLVKLIADGNFDAIFTRGLPDKL